MSLSIAIIGLPNVGKSTLFNALTDAGALAANYPFATIEPNTGIVPVPDERLDVLAKMYQTDKVVPATVEFVDVAGLVEGASKGEGLGNKFLANIRQCDAIAHVVRAFDSDKIQRADGKSYKSCHSGVGKITNDNLLSISDEPKEAKPIVVSESIVNSGQDILSMAKTDIEIVQTELALADIATIENHLPKLIKEAKSDTKLKKTVDYLTFIQNELMAGKRPEDFSSLSSAELKEKLHDLDLLTAKPIIYVFNVDENGLTDNARQEELKQLVAPSQAIFVCAKLEEELRQLSVIDAVELLADYGVEESGLVQLIHAAYETLGLQSYLTAGKKEVRAWTISQGWTAPQAAGVIHTDFEKGFIAAQVVDYDDLINAGSESAARSQGKLRTEGKTYIMRPGDVVEFRFNV